LALGGERFPFPKKEGRTDNLMRGTTYMEWGPNVATMKSRREGGSFLSFEQGRPKRKGGRSGKIPGPGNC